MHALACNGASQAEFDALIACITDVLTIDTRHA
jgi:hypothetical protein